MEEKKGVLTEIIFHNEENGYTVGVFETEEEYFTCVGCIAEPRKGATYRLTGEFRVHPGYGEQFSFTACEEVMPEGTDEIRAFLASGTVKGIGPKTAALIVDKFGEDTLRIMEESPERLTEISGIGEKKAKQIGESYAVRREFAGVSLHFQKYGITSDQAYKLYRAYGADAVALIEENPYRLVDEVYGFGFKRADEDFQRNNVRPVVLRRRRKRICASRRAVRKGVGTSRRGPGQSPRHDCDHGF